MAIAVLTMCDDRQMGSEVTVGIDVGGTKVAAVRLEGMEIAERLVEPTDKSSGEALVSQIVRLANSLKTPETTGVGAGIASEVEWKTGRVIGSVNIPLADLAVRDLLAQGTGLPAAIDNDGIAAAVGEAWQGDGLAGNLVMITIGTGVGGGVVIDGKPYRGATGAAGHLGHTIVCLHGPDPAAVEVAVAGEAAVNPSTACLKFFSVKTDFFCFFLFVFLLLLLFFTVSSYTFSSLPNIPASSSSSSSNPTSAFS